jgi:hypothetical protein
MSLVPDVRPDGRLLSVHARIIRQLVDESPGPAGIDARIAGLLFQGAQELSAGLLAAPAGRADAGTGAQVARSCTAQPR